MIVGIAGPIGSGKSTLARALSKRFSLKRISFGDYVRHVAQARGLNIGDRNVLQNLGQDLVDSDVKSFVRGVLEQANFQPAIGIVLDGIRHTAVWDEIVAFALSHESTANLIFLRMPEEERQQRLRFRGLSAEQAFAHDQHTSEVDVHNALADKADIVLDALRDRDIMLVLIGDRLGLH